MQGSYHSWIHSIGAYDVADLQRCGPHWAGDGGVQTKKPVLPPRLGIGVRWAERHPANISFIYSCGHSILLPHIEHAKVQVAIIADRLLVPGSFQDATFYGALKSVTDTA